MWVEAILNLLARDWEGAWPNIYTMFKTMRLALLGFLLIALLVSKNRTVGTKNSSLCLLYCEVLINERKVQAVSGIVYTKTFSTENANFLYRYTFRLHENGENAHENVFTSKTLSKVETFKTTTFWRRVNSINDLCEVETDRFVVVPVGVDKRATWRTNAWFSSALFYYFYWWSRGWMSQRSKSTLPCLPGHLSLTVSLRHTCTHKDTPVNTPINHPQLIEFTQTQKRAYVYV